MQLRCFAAFLLAPAGLFAQVYNDSIFTPGQDPNHVPPLSLRENLYIHAGRAAGPRSLLFDGFTAAINQWKEDPGAWGRGAEGYGKRFGTQLGRNVIRESLDFGLSAGLHSDPRVYRSIHTGVGKRLLDAVSQVLITHTNSGGRAPAFANVVSAFGSAEIQTFWLPADNAHVRDGLVGAGVMLLGDAGRDVAREFWPDIRRKLHRP